MALKVLFVHHPKRSRCYIWCDLRSCDAVSHLGIPCDCSHVITMFFLFGQHCAKAGLLLLFFVLNKHLLLLQETSLIVNHESFHTRDVSVKCKSFNKLDITWITIALYRLLIESCKIEVRWQFMSKAWEAVDLSHSSETKIWQHLNHVLKLPENKPCVVLKHSVTQSWPAADCFTSHSPLKEWTNGSLRAWHTWR